MDIYAYHHTKQENADLIFKNGFNEHYYDKVSIGFGVQCFLEQAKYSMYKGKTDGQIKVLFRNCRLLEVVIEINKSTDKIQEANTGDQKRIAKEEAERLKSLGYDAYKYDKDIIVFLNYPEPIKWIPFENQENTRKSLKDSIIELANEKD